MKRAEQSDWKNKPLSTLHKTIALNRRFTQNEMNCITMGLIPEEMEDKWFIYWNDDTLYFYRSWSGVCHYIVRFKKEDEEYIMYKADINRNPEEYKETDDTKDIERINYLINRLLLRYEVEPPHDNILANWSFIGRAMLKDGNNE